MTLGDNSRALRTLWLGFAATLVVFVVAFYLPNRFPNVLFPLAYSFAVYQYALFLFKRRYDKHLTDGGRVGSWWIVIGVSLLALLTLFGILFATVLALPGLFGDK
jgi:putative effector of murein hydrolase